MTRRKRKGGRTTPQGTRPRHLRLAPEPPPPTLLELLVSVSGQLDELTPDDARLPTRDRRALPDALEAQLDRSADVGSLVVIAAELLDDADLRSLAARRLPAESAAVEPMLAELRGAVAEGAFEVREPFDEMRQLSLGVRFPGGEAFSAIVLAEHRAGMQLVDGFVTDRPVAELRRLLGSESQLTVVDSPPAEVRRLLDDAIWRATHTLPPPVTETWPDMCALIEWAVRKLPEPAPSSDWEPIGDEAEQAFIEAFLASEERRSIRAGDQPVGEAVATMVWFKDGYTNGDLHRWGPGQIDYFLGDWALRKVADDESALRRYPSILRALVRWCHGRIGLDPDLTTTTLDAIDELEPVFREGLDPDRPLGVEALMRSVQPLVGLGGGDVLDLDLDLEDDDLDAWWTKRQAEDRAAAVGGATALAALTADPLPQAEAPAIGHLDEPLRSAAVEVAAEACRVATELYGPEYGTAASRLTVRLVDADPKALTRGNRESAVAGLVWMVASANGLRRSAVLADIQRQLGTSANPKDRARTFARALGTELSNIDDLLLGTPDVLVSARRQALIDAEAAAREAVTVTDPDLH